MSKISPKGRLKDIVRNNLGALSRSVIQNGDTLELDFGGLYVEEPGDIVKVDLSFPSGDTSTIQRVQDETGEYKLFTKRTVRVGYRYEYGGYDVRSWWDRFYDDEGNETIIRGLWPGYTIYCKFYTDGSSVTERIYLQIEYKDFDVEQDSFVLKDAQLRDDDNVSYIMQSSHSYFDGEQVETLIPLETGDFLEEYTKETKVLVKTDDYPKFEKDELDSFDDWNWKPVPDVNVTQLTPSVVQNGEQLIVSLGGLDTNGLRAVSEIVLCYVDCSQTPISSGKYDERFLNITKDVRKEEKEGTVTITATVQSVIQDANDLYRFRILFRSFDGRELYSLPRCYCASDDTIESSYDDLKVLYSGQNSSVFDLKVRAKQRGASYDEPAHPNALCLTIDKWTKEDVGGDDWWIPNSFYANKDAEDVIEDLKKCFDGLQSVDEVLWYLSYGNRELCRQVQNSVIRFRNYWSYFQANIGSDISNQFLPTDGKFTLYRVVGNEWVNPVEDWDTIGNLSYAEYLETLTDLRLCWEYNTEYRVNTLPHDSTVRLNVWGVNTASVGAGSGIGTPLDKSGDEIRFNLPFTSETVKVQMPDGYRDTEGKRFYVILQVDEGKIDYEDISGIRMTIEGVEGEFAPEWESTLKLSTEQLEALGLYLEGENFVGYRLAFDGAGIPDFVTGKMTFSLEAGTAPSLEQSIEGRVVYSYTRPEIKNLKYGFYDNLDNSKSTTEYKLQLYISWDVEDTGLASMGVVRIIQGDEEIDRNGCSFYKKESFVEDGTSKMRMSYFGSFPMETTETIDIEVQVSGIGDDYNRPATMILRGVIPREDYIVEYGHHPLYTKTDWARKAIQDNYGFYYAWDMRRKYKVLDKLKNFNGSIFYEFLIRNINDEDIIIKTSYANIMNQTLAPFCLPYQVLVKGKSLVRIGDYKYEVFKAIKPQDDGGNHTYYYRRWFVNAVTGEEIPRYSVVPIKITDGTEMDEFVPDVLVKDSDIKLIAHGTHDSSELHKYVMKIDDGSKIKYETGTNVLDDSVFSQTFENQTFNLHRRSAVTYDLTWVSSTYPLDGQNVLIHDFNSYRTVRNITKRISLLTRDHKEDVPYMDASEEEILDPTTGEPLTRVETITEGLYVGTIALNLASTSGEHTVIVVHTDSYSNVTFLVWKVTSSGIQFFNSQDLDWYKGVDKLIE